MESSKPTYEDLERRCLAAEAALAAIRSGQVDTVIGEQGLLALRLMDAEKALQETESKYRTLAEMSPEIIYVIDLAKNKSGYLNRETLLGYTLEELEQPGESLLAKVHPDDLPAVKAHWQAALSGEAAPLEYRLQHKDGSWQWLRSRLRILNWDKEGNPTQLLVTFGDVTERKQAEEKLRAIETHLRSLLEISQAMSSSLDLGLILQMIVDNVTQSLGMGSGAIYTLEDSKLYLAKTTPPLPPGFPDEFRIANLADHPHIQAAISSGAVIALPDITVVDLTEAERTISTARGLRSIVYLPLMVSKRAIGVLIVASTDKLRTFSDEEIALYTGFSGQAAQTIENIRLYESMRNYAKEMEIQISERKQAEEKLRKSEEQYRFLLDNTGDFIARFDRNGVMVFGTEASRHFNGYELGEIIGTVAFERIHPDDQAQVRRELKRMIESGLEGRSVYRLKQKNGALIWVEAVDRCVFNAAGEPEVIVVQRNITERKQAEEKLRQSEEQYRILVETSKEGIWSMDRDHFTTYVNQAMADMLGYQPGEMLGKKVEDFFFGEDLEFHQQRMQKRHAGQDEIYERRFKRRDGSPVWTLASARALKDRQGNFDGSFAMFTDITERKRAEEALRQSEERFRTVADFTYDWEYWLGEDKKLLYISPSCREITGYSRDDFINDPELLSRIIHPEDRQVYDHHMREETHDKEASALDFRIQTAGGEVRWLAHTCQTVFTSSGHRQGRRISNRDITARKQTEQKLRESEEKYRGLLKSLDSVVATVDGDGKFLYMNDMAANQLGSTPGRLIGKNMAELFPAAVAQRQMANIRMVIATNQGKTIENLSIVNGQPRWYRTSIQPLHDDNGQVSSVIVNSTDIHELKIIQQELQDLNQSLEQRIQERTEALHESNGQLTVTIAALEKALRVKDEFLANMSHELRTPLNAILGTSEILLAGLRGPLNDRQRLYVNTIDASGRHLLSLLNDILDLAKIEADKLDLHKELISIAEICQASLSFIKEPAVKKDIAVEYVPDPFVFFVDADVRRLKQILINLLSNAVKFTPEGGKIALKVKGNLTQHRIDFSVIDTGIGISAADLARLFTPFTQVDTGLTRQYEGTGLGLALVKQLVELHDGEVRVESEPGRGSTFTVSLPWELDSATEKALLAPEKAETEAIPSTEAQRFSGTILLAEDNLINAMVVGDFLESLGYIVIYADNGHETLEKAHTHVPDIILMDIQMPIIDGLEVTRRLRTETQFASTPIIALTAMAMAGDRERCLEAGANEYMGKPFSLNAMAEMIRMLLKNS